MKCIHCGVPIADSANFCPDCQSIRKNYMIAPGPIEKHAKDMTLRQWYAGQALTGLCSYFPDVVAKTLASWAFEQADAMIEAEAKDVRS